MKRAYVRRSAIGSILAGALVIVMASSAFAQTRSADLVDGSLQLRNEDGDPVGDPIEFGDGGSGGDCQSNTDVAITLANETSTSGDITTVEVDGVSFLDDFHSNDYEVTLSGDDTVDGSYAGTSPNYTVSGLVTTFTASIRAATISGSNCAGTGSVLCTVTLTGLPLSGSLVSDDPTALDSDDVATLGGTSPAESLSVSGSCPFPFDSVDFGSAVATGLEITEFAA